MRNFTARIDLSVVEELIPIKQSSQVTSCLWGTCSENINDEWLLIVFMDNLCYQIVWEADIGTFLVCLNLLSDCFMQKKLVWIKREKLKVWLYATDKKSKRIIHRHTERGIYSLILRAFKKFSRLVWRSKARDRCP